MSDIQMLDLFSGMGAGAYGIQKVYPIALAIDKMKYAYYTYRANFRETKVEKKDINDMDFVRGDFMGLFSNSPIGLVSTPPCQPFSITNLQKQEDDERKNGLELTIDIIDKIHPEMGFIEEVAHVPITLMQHVAKTIKKFGYYVVLKKIRAYDYGSVQATRRWILTFSTKRSIFPQQVINRKTAKHVIRNTKDSRIDIVPTQALLDKVQGIKTRKGKLWYAIPGQSKFENIYIADPDEPFPKILNPNKYRYLTYDRSDYIPMRDLLRAQGLPYDFKLCTKKKTVIGQMIANALPAELAFAIANAFKPYHN